MEQLLTRAMKENIPMEVIYMSANGNITQRVIFIKEVNQTKIRAYCSLRKQMRTFFVGNILSVLPVRQTYRRTS